jgi:hypothetical protein
MLALHTTQRPSAESFFIKYIPTSKAMVKNPARIIVAARKTAGER